MNISACLIVRNEERTLERCLTSIRPFVAEICVLDTGSTDGSEVIARRYADRWEQWTGCNDPEGRIADFSAARNRNLAMASQEVVLWLDGDDELTGGENLAKLVSEAPGAGTGQAWSYLAEYEYDHDPQGRPVTLQWRERLVYPRERWEWRGPVHEGLLAKAGGPVSQVMTDAFRVVHRRRAVDKPMEPERNLRILRAWFAANGESDARLMHYFGSELLIARHVGEALYWFRRHIQMAPWSDERCLSLLQMARVYLAIGDNAEAARLALEATATKTWPEPWWLLGQAYVSLSEQGIDAEYNLRRGLHALEQGMRHDASGEGRARTLLMTDPQARYEAHVWLSGALAKVGRIDEAIVSAEKGLAGKPEHELLMANLVSWRTARARHRVSESVAELVTLNALPEEARFIVEAALSGTEITRVEPERVPLPDGKLDIVFFLGHQLEPWTPRTLERNGMGGSETMAWAMSKRLAALEHRVRVFAHCTVADQQTYDGVEWFDEAAFRNLSCDVLIVSRRCEAALAPSVKATARVLWVHDVHVGPAFTPAIAIKYDFVWCLSKWHRETFLQMYPWLPPAKVEVTRNGIDPARFDVEGIVRNPHRAIYSSSPDRGLVDAVRAWPEVRKRVPDAELHCFYGFDSWDKMLELMGEHPSSHCNRAAREELRGLLAKTDGVVMRGRVGGDELAREMLAAGVWCYPTWFAETSCITAMETQAARLRCVCPPLAALAETVDDGNRIWTGDLVADTVAAMQWWDRIAKSYTGQPGDFALDTLAEEWQHRLNNLVTDARVNVVPAFSEVAK